MEIRPGDKMTWLYEPRGGYGYVVPVNAEVKRVTAKRVQIEVEKANGEKALRSVTADRLRPREESR